MTIVAALRPDDQDLPLLLHVLGAMLLVGTLMVAVTALALGWRLEHGPRTVALDRLGFWALVASIPAWLLMRLPAQWIFEEQGYDAGEEPGWMFVGIAAAEGGGALLLLTTIAFGYVMRRARRRDEARRLLPRIATVVTAGLLLAYVVAMWAMTAKPR